jgi:TATA-binding protein-associated factor Taf7
MEGDIPVHFYNKFALFPLFKSIAYGFTKDLYEKMQEDGVDMLMFESAVKVGSEGKQEFNPDTFRRSDDENDENNWKHDKDGNRTEMKPDIRNFHFNTYK